LAQAAAAPPLPQEVARFLGCRRGHVGEGSATREPSR
jgi:hypothetical protein